MAHPIDHIRERIDISPEQEAALCSLMRRHTFRRGETLSALNDIRMYVFFIVKGSARVFYLRGSKERTFSFALDDEFVMLSRTLMDRPYSQMTIEFLEPTEVIFIPLSDMRTLMREMAVSHIAEISTVVMTALHELTLVLEERLLMFQSASAVERYNWFVGRYPKILERATITQIASFLGVTKETLYRIRAGKYKSGE